MESARRASEIHKKRTGKGFRITEQDVMNEEMYEEEDDDLSARALARGYLRNIYGSPDSRLTDYLNHALYMGNLVQRSVDEQYSRAFPHAPQFPTNYGGLQNTATKVTSPTVSSQYSPVQAMWNPLQAAQIAALQQQTQAQQHTLPQQFMRAGVNFHQVQQGPTQTQHQTSRFQAPQIIPQLQTQGYNQAQAMLQLTPGLMHHGLQQHIPANFRPPFLSGAPNGISIKSSPITSTQLTPQPSPVALPHRIDLGPLSATIPPEAQQFIAPTYNFLGGVDVPELKKPNSPDSGSKGQISVKEEVKQGGKKSAQEDEEPSQLNTPAESPSGASIQSVPDLTDDAASTNNCSPESFTQLNTDIISTGSFSSGIGKEPSILIPSDHTISPTEGSHSLSGYEDVFNLNFDSNYEWTVNHDWTHDAFSL